jgi:hypothetical protein
MQSSEFESQSDQKRRKGKNLHVLKEAWVTQSEDLSQEGLYTVLRVRSHIAWV